MRVNMPDVLVVGCGGGGAVIAKELAEAGLGVVALEAGPWHDPQRDFTGLEWDMLNPIDAVFRWGPADRTKPPWPRRRDGIPLTRSVFEDIRGVARAAGVPFVLDAAR